MPKLIIGSTAFVSLPDVQLMQLPAKIDTGAYYNTLHCSQTELVMVDEQPALRFMVLDPDMPQYTGSWWYARRFRQITIRNSAGQADERFVVLLKLEVLGVELITNFTLTQRANKQFPVLLGRCMLKGRFLVDVEQHIFLNNEQ